MRRRTCLLDQPKFKRTLLCAEHTLLKSRASEGCPRTDLGYKPGSVFPQGQLLQETLHSMQSCSPSFWGNHFLTWINLLLPSILRNETKLASVNGDGLDGVRRLTGSQKRLDQTRKYKTRKYHCIDKVTIIYLPLTVKSIFSWKLL